MSPSFSSLRSASACLALLGAAPCIRAQDTNPAQPGRQAAGAAAPAASRLFIREFRVQGATALPPGEVQRSIYPWLGPGRTTDDIEAARAALEKLYRESGYQAATVEVPPQRARQGMIVLRVNEGRIGKLRVTGARYHEPERIRAEAPSLAEGKAADFNAISRDIVSLNRLPTRRVLPEVVPGEQPGELDVNLKVEDSLPLSASAELNNRYSAGTSHLRLNLAASYDNLWQSGHSFGVNAQTSPEEWSEVLVYSGSYTARFASLPEWTFLASATRQDTDISTLGGAAVAGRGEIYGLRATRVLPGSDHFFHSFSFGLDRKDYEQALTTAGVTNATPILYYPLALTYSGFHDGKGAQTEFFAGVTLHFRGLGSDSEEFSLNRTGADANFATLRGDVTHTRELPAGFAVAGRVQGQVASGALLSNEQISGGGIDTVRGYVEGEVFGDHGLFGGLELISPSLLPGSGVERDLRFLVFAEGGALLLSDALPQQTDHFELATLGFGARFRLFRHFSGHTYLAFPLIDQGETEKGDARLHFSIRGSL